MHAVDDRNVNGRRWSGVGRTLVALFDHAAPLVLLFGCFTAYAATLTSAYTYDSIAYATQIRQYSETGKVGWLMHPHHLLYNPLGYAFWVVLSWLGIGMDPLKSLQYMNAIFGAIGAVLIYEILRMGGLHISGTAREGVGRLPALTAAMIISTGYGYWVCATDGRVNIPALTGVMLVIGFGWGMLNQPRLGQVIALSAATILAVLLHQSNGILIFAGCGAVLLSDGANGRQRQRLLLTYLSTSIIGIACAYIGVGVLVKGARSIADLQTWMLAYAHDGRWWSFNIQENLRQDLFALTRVFFTTDSRLGSNVALVVLAALAVAQIYVIWLLAYRGRQPAALSFKRLVVLGMVAIPYAAFFTVWNPGYFVFWLPTAIALVICLAMAVSALKPGGRYTLSALGLIWMASAMALNTSAIRYRTDRAHNPDLTICNSLKRHAHAGDMFLITGTYSKQIAATPYLEVYVPYFTRVSVKTALGECKRCNGDITQAICSLRGVITNRFKSGNQVLVMKEFLSPSAWHTLRQRYPDSLQMSRRILFGYKLQPVMDGKMLIAYRLIPISGPRYPSSKFEH